MVLEPPLSRLAERQLNRQKKFNRRRNGVVPGGKAEKVYAVFPKNVVIVAVLDAGIYNVRKLKDLNILSYVYRRCSI